MTSARLLGLAVAATLVSGCGPLSILASEGPGAAEIARLWWWLFWMTIIPTVFVLGFLGLAIHRGRRARAVSDAPASSDIKIIVGIGAMMPLAVILVLLVQSFITGTRTAEPPQTPTLTVEVIAHQFWWEIRYPDLGIVTANEIHIPAGESTRLELTSADVIHSFWVPALHGKIDTNPGRVNVFWLHPDRPGVYRGQCAEFCGTQHALMGFLVVAEPRDAFDSWIEQRRQAATPAAEAAAARGQEVFELGGCNQCHAVNGIFEPLVRTGPDLTHLASRRTLAAATVPNTSEHLRAFIRDPHARKPGVRMPANPLPDEDLDALVTFLQGRAVAPLSIR
jgi:cytochrome c oxidase subunit 2